jgi:hypothetical protein
LQSTLAFVSDVLLACNQFHEQGNEKEAEMIINLMKQHIIGYRIVFSQELQSYVLVPGKTEKK